MRGFLGAVLGLSGLYVLVARADTEALQGLAGTPARLLKSFVDPTVPGIPERGTSSGPAPAPLRVEVSGTLGQLLNTPAYPTPTARR